MKKSRLLGAVCAILFSLITVSANAALIDRGGGLIYDEDLNITWMQNAYPVGDVEMEWQVAMDWAANFSYYDTVRNVTYTDWRLPKADPACGTQLRCYDNELGHLYYIEAGDLGKFTNIQTSGESHKYWTNEIPIGNPGFPYNFNFLTGRQEINSQFVDYINVWAVRDGDVFVPLPAAAWLFGSGLLGLIGVARRRK